MGDVLLLSRNLCFQGPPTASCSTSAAQQTCPDPAWHAVRAYSACTDASLEVEDWGMSWENVSVFWSTADVQGEANNGVEDVRADDIIMYCIVELAVCTQEEQART